MCVLYTQTNQQVRLTGSGLEALLDGTALLNGIFNSVIVTEFAFNGLGILEKVDDEHKGKMDIPEHLRWACISNS